MATRRKRRQARRVLLQALSSWQWQDRTADLPLTIRWLDSEGSLNNADRDFFVSALNTITQVPSKWDAVFERFLDRDISALDGVELAVLRAGSFELYQHREIATSIVINEWIELTKQFGATDSFKYINGVLHNVAESVRSEPLGEFELIDVILEELRDCISHPMISVETGDDAGVIQIPEGQDLVVTTDVLQEGTHFPKGTRPDLIGYRAMAANFSDLAAMCAIPYFTTIALTIDNSDPAWLRGFAQGVALASKEFGSVVLGGNLNKGLLSISVTAHGLVPFGQAISRDGAVVGDDLWLTGKIGATNAFLESADPLPDLPIFQLRQRRSESASLSYFMPRPRVEIASRLRHIAHSAIDISDGLLSDLNHLAQKSGCGARIQIEDVPVWSEAPLPAAYGADDSYELLFTAPTYARATIQAVSEEVGTPVSRIGHMVEGSEVQVTKDGKSIDLPQGYRHF